MTTVVAIRMIKSETGIKSKDKHALFPQDFSKRKKKKDKKYNGIRYNIKQGKWL